MFYIFLLLDTIATSFIPFDLVQSIQIGDNCFYETHQSRRAFRYLRIALY